MTSRGAANRYARALFDVAQAENKDVVRTFEDVKAFGDLISTNTGLQRALTNPAVPKGRKRAVIEQLLAQAGDVQPAVVKLLLMLAERDRLAIVPEIAQAFEQRLMDFQNVIRAEVVTAMTLPDERVSAIREGLRKATGRDVRLESRVDPAILGGAVARIGSTVYDGSIVRQLERLRETLTSSAD